MIITFAASEFHFHAHPVMPLGRDDSNKARVKTGDLSLSKHCVRISIICLFKGNGIINTFRCCAYIFLPKMDVANSWTPNVHFLTSNSTVIARLFYAELFIDCRDGVDEQELIVCHCCKHALHAGLFPYFCSSKANAAF